MVVLLLVLIGILEIVVTTTTWWLKNTCSSRSIYSLVVNERKHDWLITIYSSCLGSGPFMSVEEKSLNSQRSWWMKTMNQTNFCWYMWGISSLHSTIFNSSLHNDFLRLIRFIHSFTLIQYMYINVKIHVVPPISFKIYIYDFIPFIVPEVTGIDHFEFCHHALLNFSVGVSFVWYGSTVYTI